MPISVTCPGCGVTHQVQDSMAGQQAQCNCGHVLSVPYAAVPAAPHTMPQATPAQPITVMCGHCGQTHNADPSLAGQQATCGCGNVIQIPAARGGVDDMWSDKIGGGDDEYRLAADDQSAFPSPHLTTENDMLLEHSAKSAREVPNYSADYDDDDEGGSAWGWIIFILVFGVGNFILYQTTGIIFIPIPRR